MFATLLDFLFPRRTRDGAEGAWLTEHECEHMFGRPFVLTRGQFPSPGLGVIDTLAAAARFTRPGVRETIHAFKYKKIRSLRQPLGWALANAADQLTYDATTVVCAVPLHWSRRFGRGFNQAEFLAGAVADAHRLTHIPLLKRTRSTGSQAKRNRAERLAALSGAFAVPCPVPAHVILVDDVCTTGSTLGACAAVLKQAGAARVDALVLALD